MNENEFKYKTYRSAFYELLNMYITETQCENWFKQLEMAGFTEEEVCYAINKEYLNIRSRVLSDTFWTYFVKAIFRVYNDNRKEKYDAIVKENKKIMKCISKMPSSINGYIYFIQGINGGPIKIGFSENVEKRLKALQTASFEELVVIKQIKATSLDEHKIHNELNKFRIRGEWFTDALEVKNRIKMIQDLRI